MRLVHIINFCGGGQVRTPKSATAHTLGRYQYYIKHPKQAQILKIEGTIILTFDVDSTCSFINRKQDIKLGHGCDDIAWDTLDKMEKDFKKNNANKCPDLKNTMNIPVMFKLR